MYFGIILTSRIQDDGVTSYPLINLVTLRVFIPTSRQVQRFQSSTKSPVNLHFSETISGVSTVRAFGVQDRFTREFQVV